jgi:isopentenyl phosphate kinase
MMLTFVKLGGSLITDKHVEASFREAIMAELAEAIASARRQNPDLRLLIGHGSGSFGHFPASRYRIIQGVHTQEEWMGYAQVADVAGDLNHRVANALRSANVPVLRFQPSASAVCEDGVIVEMAVEAIRRAIGYGQVPLVYGDVALDVVRGGTIISTEAIFLYLANHLPVSRILLLGEVDGVQDEHGDIIPEITPQNYPGFESVLTESAGVDVTGGMLNKVRLMLELVSALPSVNVRIFNGTQAGLLERTLLKQAAPGTLISAGN